MNAELTEQSRPVIPAVKLVAGLFFALLGIVMTLDNLGVIDGSQIVRYWPVVFIVVGLVKLRDRSGTIAAILCILAGSFLLAGSLRLIRFSLFDAWPLILIVGGGALVMRSLGWSPGLVRGHDGRVIWAVLSRFREVVSAQDYTGGRAIAFMGGCEIDLTGAAMADGSAVLDVLATWGAMIILVPPGWVVVDEAIPIMGAIDIRTDGAVAGPRLIIRGLALMGAIEVKTRRGDGR
ncbi:MAG: DUF5668 domain-containing protein [Acidobacteriota bacterium]